MWRRSIWLAGMKARIPPIISNSRPPVFVAVTPGLDDRALLKLLPRGLADGAFARQVYEPFRLVVSFDDEIHDAADAWGSIELFERHDALELCLDSGKLDEHIVATDGVDSSALQLVGHLAAAGFFFAGLRRARHRAGGRARSLLHPLVD